MISRTGKGRAAGVFVAAAVAALVCGTAVAQRGHDGDSRNDGLRHAVGHAGGFASDGGGFAGSMVPVHGFHRGGRSRNSFVFIAPGPFYDPFFYPFGQPYYGYYPPPVVAVPSAPPVYVQRAPVAVPEPEPSGYWYWCSEPQGYYPAVRACPGGWQAVPPRPPTR